jgi:hypothetical protein
LLLVVPSDSVDALIGLLAGCRIASERHRTPTSATPGERCYRATNPCATTIDLVGVLAAHRRRVHPDDIPRLGAAGVRRRR